VDLSVGNLTTSRDLSKSVARSSRVSYTWNSSSVAGEYIANVMLHIGESKTQVSN